MKLVPTRIDGLFEIHPERREDERGWLVRTFCAETFEAAGLAHRVSQSTASFNRRRGTLRGMHYQPSPHLETKLVRCTRGRVFDVIVDVRRGSPSYRSWHALELSAENGVSVFLPGGVAHGFLTLEDSSELLYQMDMPHVPDAGRGLRFDDPGLGIPWPEPPQVISDRDRTYPDFAW